MQAATRVHLSRAFRGAYGHPASLASRRWPINHEVALPCQPRIDATGA
jgi:hypothetical protein